MLDLIINIFIRKNLKHCKNIYYERLLEINRNWSLWSKRFSSMNQIGTAIIKVTLTKFGIHPPSIICQFRKSPITTSEIKKCSCCSVLFCILTSLFFLICIQCWETKKLMVMMQNNIVLLWTNVKTL